MEFSPNNPVVKLCLQGIACEEKGSAVEARRIFTEAWNQASENLDKFLSAFFLGRVQENASEKLKWFEVSSELASKINDDSVRSALPTLYQSIAKCFEEQHDFVNAKNNLDLGRSIDITPVNSGPFYHGTRAELKTGDLLTPGGDSNYQAGLKMNHIYFTARKNGAGLAAELAKGDQPPRVYIVEPTGPFECDPNVTNNKFPGNPTLSYRSERPLKIIGEITDWERQTPKEIENWRKKLAASKGEIIN